MCTSSSIRKSSYLSKLIFQLLDALKESKKITCLKVFFKKLIDIYIKQNQKSEMVWQNAINSELSNKKILTAKKLISLIDKLHPIFSYDDICVLNDKTLNKMTRLLIEYGIINQYDLKQNDHNIKIENNIYF